MLVIFLAAGLLYVYIIDRTPPKAKITNAPASVQPAPVLPKPTAPGANAPEGVSVEAVTNPVTLGNNGSIVVSTNAGSTCSILVKYGGAASTDSGLAPKKSDVYGNVSWSWTVPKTTPVGTWPIVVTCVYNGRSGVVDSSFVVTK